MEHTDQALETTAEAAAPRSARWCSAVVLVLAVGTAVTLLAAGSELPAWGPVLMLAVVAALSVNQFVLFPTEHAATAEAAVLLAAVVGFRDTAPYLGPVVLALLVGPLDVLHWEQRSFVRMAYNAGNRGLATLAAATTFAAGRAIGNDSTLASVVVVLLACLAFAVVDFAISVVLLRTYGESLGAAVRHLLDVDVLTCPIACVGATAGLLAGDVGWWATAIVLLPAAYLPVLVINHARAPAVAIRDLAVALTVASTLAMVALITSVPATAVLATLCALAVAAGIELGLDRGLLVPPLVAVVVVAAAVVVDADEVRLATALVALVATATSWWCARTIRRVRFLAALGTALGAALFAGQTMVMVPRTVEGIAAGALVAGVLFEVAAVVVAPARRRRTATLVWSLPILGASIAGAGTWAALHHEAWAAYAFVVLAALCVWVCWGAPAWRSRVVGRIAARISSRALVPVLVVTAIGAVAVAMVAVATTDRSSALAAAWSAAALGEMATAMAAAGVRQWRLAPRPRAVGVVVIAVVSSALVMAGVPLVARGSAWGPAVIGAAMVVVVAVARVPAARNRATRTWASGSRASGEVEVR